MVVERILLQTLKFDLTVVHPYTFLTEYSQMFASKTDKADINKVVR